MSDLPEERQEEKRAGNDNGWGFSHYATTIAGAGLITGIISIGVPFLYLGGTARQVENDHAQLIETRAEVDRLRDVVQGLPVQDAKQSERIQGARDDIAAIQADIKRIYDRVNGVDRNGVDNKARLEDLMASLDRSRATSMRLSVRLDELSMRSGEALGKLAVLQQQTMPGNPK